MKHEPKYISELKSIGTEELAKMNRQEVLKLLKKTAPRIEAKRQRSIEQLNKWGIDTFSYRQTDSKTVRSWRNTSFDYSEDENLGKLKSRVRLMQKFINSGTTTVEGIKQSIKSGIERYYKLMGISEPKTFSYANYAKQLKNFWDTIDKLRELKGSKNNWGSLGSAKVFSQVAQEINNSEFDNDVVKLLDKIEEYISNEYEKSEKEQIQNTPREFTTSSFFDEEGND